MLQNGWNSEGWCLVTSLGAVSGLVHGYHVSDPGYLHVPETEIDLRLVATLIRRSPERAELQKSSLEA